MSSDWRADNAEHLRGVKFRKRQWIQPSACWDHDHCSGCWAKFAAFEGADILHEGYTTCSDYDGGGGYFWVCPECFSELQAELGWFDVSAEEPPLKSKLSDPK
jgi:hypothetical protein